jgi:adenylate cyclase
VPLFRFRRFGTRLLALLLGLLFAALALTYAFVSRANHSTAMAHSESNLEVGAEIFDETIRQRIEFLSGSARVLARDYAILQTLPEDQATLNSMLETYTSRVRASVIALFEPDGTWRAANGVALAPGDVEPFRALIGTAMEKDPEEDSGFAYLGNTLHVLVVVPIYAPYPEIAAWFGLAFPIDGEFAQRIKETTRLEVTLVSTTDPARPRVLATTLPAEAGELVAGAVASNRNAGQRINTLELPGERYVTLFKTERLLGEAPITVALQRPLSAELAAARELERSILFISFFALAVATLIALWISRGVSRPVLQLAEHTKHVAAGDYTRRLDLQREDELGLLAHAFNDMSAGLAERDLVRDLLDKNVSPEVAAQLMRDGAALGGEERDVTVLFADLRGFTTLSEKLAPRDLLTLLNRYLDRMSIEIERQGGVIDKFIGDAIMALFGAPVSHGDAADRAVSAALAMERALAGLNAELAAEAAGTAPLAIGVGINTARVVAGNIGSHRRLNYSVIGDGVNVAARLQALTRTPEYRTDIIISAATRDALGGTRTVEPWRTAENGNPNAGKQPVGPAAVERPHLPASLTFRPLGKVAVKGRAEPVEIFAVGE